MQEQYKNYQETETTETAYWECPNGYFPEIPINDNLTKNIELLVKTQEE
jgi:hypothetical protein